MNTIFLKTPPKKNMSGYALVFGGVSDRYSLNNFSTYTRLTTFNNNKI